MVQDSPIIDLWRVTEHKKQVQVQKITKEYGRVQKERKKYEKVRLDNTDNIRFQGKRIE